MMKIQKFCNYIFQNIRHRKHIIKYEEIKKFPFLSKRENEQRQLNKLNKLLIHAYNNIPYYRKKFQLCGYTEKDIKLKSVSELQKFPFLTKQIIQNENIYLHSPDITKRKATKNSTGGSTGEPVVFLQDEEYKTNNFANFYITQSWRGLDPYDSVFKLWGAGRDTFDGKKPLKILVSDFFRNRMQFNCYKMAESDINFFLEQINLYQPKIILAYAYAIYEVAQYVKKNNIYVKKQNAIHSTAGTLFDFMRDEIEEVFQCQVFDHYGSREAGCIASECKEHDGSHIMMEHTLVEIIKEDGTPCQDGEEGEIVITTLNNFSMPLIRYKIGDIGSIQQYKECSCGCSYPKLDKIKGRTLERIKTITNDIISPEYFVCQIGGDKNFSDIEKFQIIQKDLTKIIIRIVRKTELSPKHIDDIVDKVKAIMGHECKVEFEYVTEISKTKTGKYLYVISEL